jgi:hypothetical protein
MLASKAFEEMMVRFEPPLLLAMLTIHQTLTTRCQSPSLKHSGQAFHLLTASTSQTYSFAACITSGSAKLSIAYCAWHKQTVNGSFETSQVTLNHGGIGGCHNNQRYGLRAA